MSNKVYHMALETPEAQMPQNPSGVEKLIPRLPLVDYGM